LAQLLLYGFMNDSSLTLRQTACLRLLQKDILIWRLRKKRIIHQKKCSWL